MNIRKEDKDGPSKIRMGQGKRIIIVWKRRRRMALERKIRMGWGKKYKNGTRKWGNEWVLKKRIRMSRTRGKEWALRRIRLERMAWGKKDRIDWIRWKD
jgi:hypothetical protein